MFRIMITKLVLACFILPPLIDGLSAIRIGSENRNPDDKKEIVLQAANEFGRISDVDIDMKRA